MSNFGSPTIKKIGHPVCYQQWGNQQSSVNAAIISKYKKYMNYEWNNDNV